MKVSTNFYLTEFVPKDVYEAYGEKSLQFVDERIIYIAQFVRDTFGKSVTINDWWDGGQYKESGYRSPDSKTGAFRSQHKAGRAIDIKVSGMTAKQVYDYIMSHEELFIQAGVTAMENITATPTWVHLDCRNTRDESKILIVNP